MYFEYEDILLVAKSTMSNLLLLLFPKDLINAKPERSLPFITKIFEIFFLCNFKMTF